MALPHYTVLLLSVHI